MKVINRSRSFYDLYETSVSSPSLSKGNESNLNVVELSEAGNQSSLTDDIIEDLDIYIDNTKYMYDKRLGFKTCLLGQCIFHPNKRFSGDIARIVFYYFLMYAYDFTKRPSTNEIPWYANVDPKNKNQCQGFNFEK